MIDRKSSLEIIFNSTITITDINNIEYRYRISSVLLISRYSDTLIVIKKKQNKYIQYVNNSNTEQLTLNRLHDLFDTSSTILGFHRQKQV